MGNPWDEYDTPMARYVAFTSILDEIRTEAMERKMTVTLKAQDPPGHNGWQGYKHYVDVLLNGEKIGELHGSGHNKSKLEYSFDGSHPLAQHCPKMVLPVGLKAAKEMVEKALRKTQA